MIVTCAPSPTAIFAALWPTTPPPMITTFVGATQECRPAKCHALNPSSYFTRRGQQGQGTIPFPDRLISNWLVNSGSGARCREVNRFNQARKKPVSLGCGSFTFTTISARDQTSSALVDIPRLSSNCPVRHPSQRKQCGHVRQFRLPSSYAPYSGLVCMSKLARSEHSVQCGSPFLPQGRYCCCHSHSHNNARQTSSRDWLAFAVSR